MTTFLHKLSALHLMIEHKISAIVEIGWETLKEARSYQDVMQFALSKLARGLAEELLKREDIHSRKESDQGVTLSAEFYCLTREQLNQIVQDAIQDITLSRIGEMLRQTTQEDNS